MLASEAAGVANKDEAVAGAGEQHVDPLGLAQEADLAGCVAAGEGDNDNARLFALEVVNRGHPHSSATTRSLRVTLWATAGVTECT